MHSRNDITFNVEDRLTLEYYNNNMSSSSLKVK